MDQEFAGRTALVTGGSRGIGRACVLALAAAGARVAINYRSHQAAAEKTLAEVRSRGGTAELVQADVSQAEQVDRMVEEVSERFGPVDLLVNNAGVFDHVSHEDTTLEIWQRALEINLTSAYLVTWAVKGGMIEREWGRIVNVASIAGLRARPSCIAYSVSKAGLIAFTRSLAQAIAADGVRVNAVAPGLTETDILADVDQSKLDALIEATPMRRIGQPEEMAEVVTFLLSDRSSFMTGQTVAASGGRVLLP